VESTPRTISEPLRDTIRREYLVYEREFDIIPALCYFSKGTGHKNTLCYVKEMTIMHNLNSLVNPISFPADSAKLMTLYIDRLHGGKAGFRCAFYRQGLVKQSHYGLRLTDRVLSIL
jgi:hypothetical protein